MEKTIQSSLLERLEKAPQGRAITFYDRSGNFEWKTFETFYKQVSGYAAALRERGLGKGDVCILVLPSGEFSASLVLAILLNGGIPLLIAPPALQSKGAYSSLMQIIQRIIRKTKPGIVVCDHSLRKMGSDFQRIRRGTQFLFGEQAFENRSKEIFPTVLPAENDVAAMQLTSGTTGFPRVCVWKQKNVLAALDGMVAAMKLDSQTDVCLNWTPLYHDMGLVNNFLLCMVSGTPVVMLDPVDFVKKPALWLRSLDDTQATTTWSPNFGFAISAQRIRDQEIEGVDLSHVRAFWNAAERIHLDTLVAFQERFTPYGLRQDALKTNFGCAENVGGATFSDPDGPYLVEHIDRDAFHEKRTAIPVSASQNGTATLSVVGVGRPHPAMTIQILSRAGRPLPDGHVGEIGLDTPSRMEGYLNDARANRKALFGDLLRTGDLGYMRDGELFWVGRVKERINVRGKKLDPSDFEPILLQVQDLRKGCFAAFGVDHTELGTQQIVVVTEVRDPSERTPEQISGQIRTMVLNKLGMNVNDILLVKPGTLTKTSSGKRRHRYFRELYLDGRLKDFEWKPEVNGAEK